MNSPIDSESTADTHSPPDSGSGSDATGSTTQTEKAGFNSGYAVLAVVVLATVGLIAALSGGDAADEATDGFTTIPFTTVNGGTATLADYDGEPMVVNFFASWCPPCRAELPDFEVVSQENPEVTFVGISHDLDETSWRSLVQEFDLSYDTFYQPGTEIWTELGGQAMPTTVFISADGEVLETHAGLLTADRLQELIDELLTTPF